MVDRLDLQRISLVLRRLGWGQFRIQLSLAVVVFVVLLLTSNGGLAAAAERSLGPGLALTTLAFLVLLFSLWQCWSVVRCGRGLDSAGARPSKGETSRLLRRGLLASLLGLTLGIVGYQALAGSLVRAGIAASAGFLRRAGGSRGGGRQVGELPHHLHRNALRSEQYPSADGPSGGIAHWPLPAASAPRRRPWATAHHGSLGSKDKRETLLHPQLSAARLNHGFLP